MYTFVSFSLPGNSTSLSGSGTLLVKPIKLWSLKMRMMKTWKVGYIQEMSTRLGRLCRELRHEGNSCARSSSLHHRSSVHWGNTTLILKLIPKLLCCLTCFWLAFDFSSRLNSDTVDYEDSCLIVRYLASMRPFAQSFDVYLSQVRALIHNRRYFLPFFITNSLCISYIDSESPGWKCYRSKNKSHEVSLRSGGCGSKYSCTGKPSSHVSQAANAANILFFMFSNTYLCLTIPFAFQLDMQRGVHCRLMDNSTSVREAAVELLGRFVLSRPQLIEQYYDMLIERILVLY